MPQIPYATLEDAPKDYQELVAANPRLWINILAMWANSPATIKLAALWGQAQFTSLSLLPSDRELVICLTGFALQSEYEVFQHLPMALAAGCTQGQLDFLKRYGTGREVEVFESEEARGVFSEKERVLMRWVMAVIIGPKVEVGLMDEVKAHFTPREMTEVLTCHGFYYMVARITTVLDIDIDEVDGLDVIQAFQGINK